jgi:hypothetical protein
VGCNLKLISPESLSPNQRSILEGYSRFFPAGSVCVNVMLGAEPWDIRPLILSLGKVTLVRFSAPLGDNLARSLASEIEAVAMLSDNQQRVQLLPGEGRFMVIRPYFQETLRDLLDAGTLPRDVSPLDLVRSLIRRILELDEKGAAHGHIAPSNIVMRQDGILLIDSLLGALHHSSDLFLAPESSKGRSPVISSDLFGLGRTIRAVVREGLTQSQELCVDKMLMTDPRERPDISEVAKVFGVRGEIHKSSSASNDTDRPSQTVNSGRLVRQSSGGRPQRGTEHIVPDETIRSDRGNRGRSKSFLPPLLVGVCLLAASVWFIKDRYPALYFELVSRIPLLAPQHSVEYEADWASRDRASMATVGRAAVIRREPAAVNTIINDLISGSNPEFVNGAVIRVAFNESWRADLSPADQHAALVAALDQLVPEGRSQIHALRELHPGVLLALLGQGPSRFTTPEIKQLPIDVLSKLPEPFGSLFSQVRAMGANKLGDEPAIGLAAIVTGNPGAAAFKRFLGDEVDPARLLAKVSVILPAVSASEPASAELVSALAERGGDLSTIIGWFDLVDLAGWSKVRGSEKLSLILGSVPQSGMTQARLADLLTFPIEPVRQQAIAKLADIFKGQDIQRLLVTLATPANGLTREQIISLLSALKLPAQSRTPFISAWFDLKPSSEAVLLILLSRSNVDSTDVFNLEAARYLRKAEWSAQIDVLKLLSLHPEPLARVIAYGRLNPSVDAERSILLERQLSETNESCLTVLKERIASTKPRK